MEHDFCQHLVPLLLDFFIWCSWKCAVTVAAMTADEHAALELEIGTVVEVRTLGSVAESCILC